MLKRIVMMLSVLTLAISAMGAEGNAKPIAAPTPVETAAMRKAGRYLATIAMQNGGVIEVVLEGTDMPYTTANFVKLAKANFYNGLNFHRVEPGFVIQGGDPNGDGSGGPGYMINLEISPLLRHKKGAISMARTNKPDTAGCQFFITLADTPFLDGAYAVFGWVKSGIEVVDNVAKGDKIKSITVKQYDGKEPNPLVEEK